MRDLGLTKYSESAYPARISSRRKNFVKVSLSMRGERMKNVTDSFISLIYLSSAEGFRLNTNILETNIINLSVVLGVLIYFGKGVCASCIFE